MVFIFQKVKLHRNEVTEKMSRLQRQALKLGKVRLSLPMHPYFSFLVCL